MLEGRFAVLRLAAKLLRKSCQSPWDSFKASVICFEDRNALKLQSKLLSRDSQVQKGLKKWDNKVKLCFCRSDSDADLPHKKAALVASKTSDTAQMTDLKLSFAIKEVSLDNDSPWILNLRSTIS